MLISYFDSSILLSILQDEPRMDEAMAIWNESSIRISSVLFKFETNISLRRRYAELKNRARHDWLDDRLLKLGDFFNEIFFMKIDIELENHVSRYYDELSKCKSLDAIHLSTAIRARENPNNRDIRVCSFDQNMLATAESLGFRVAGCK